MFDSKSHWENIYKTKLSKEVSWFRAHLDRSLELILPLSLPKNTAIIDIGGSIDASDDLLAEGFKNITVFDISAEALNVSKERLGKKADHIQWLEGDITQISLKADYYGLWHDRAVFHFLTKPEDKQKYINNLSRSLKHAGYVLTATFGPNGPLKCSGLEIARYSAELLQKELGDLFHLEKHVIEIHKTSFDTTQEFLYCLFRKR